MGRGKCLNQIINFHAFLVQAVNVFLCIFCTFQPSTNFLYYFPAWHPPSVSFASLAPFLCIICQPDTLPLYYFASLTPFLCIIPPAGTLCVFYFASVALSLCLAPRVERPSASFPPFLGVRACVLLSQGVINLWGAPCRTLLYAVRFSAL